MTEDNKRKLVAGRASVQPKGDVYKGNALVGYTETVVSPIGSETWTESSSTGRGKVTPWSPSDVEMKLTMGGVTTTTANGGNKPDILVRKNTWVDADHRAVRYVVGTGVVCAGCLAGS